MMDQTRETLTDVLERAMSMDDDVPIWAYNYRKTGAVAAALRDVLTTRTCSTIPSRCARTRARRTRCTGASR